jgi:hypothetical protein
MKNANVSTLSPTNTYGTISLTAAARNAGTMPQYM